MTIDMNFYIGIVCLILAYVLIARIWCRIADAIGSMIGLKWLIQRLLDQVDKMRGREQ